MKLTFESNLVYQQEAIQAAVNLFEGQMSEESGCQYSLNENGVLDLTAGIGNRLVLSKEQIYQSVWKNNYGDIGTVAVNIKSLRNKLDTDEKYIKTIWGMGYKFVKDAQ